MSALVGMATSALLSACGGAPASVEGSRIHVLVGPEHVGAVAGVGFGGQVRMVGSCLGIDATTVIWPYGTKVVSESPVIVDVPGLGHLSPGDTVSGGGEQWTNRLPKGIDALPAGCSGHDVLEFWPDHP